MSNNTLTVTGIVGTEPRHYVTDEGLPIASFRFVSTQRRYDRANEKWIDGDTNWFTVTSFRTLATNVARSVSKGDQITSWSKAPCALGTGRKTTATGPPPNSRQKQSVTT